MNKTLPARPAFTLIELMVVVAILALLVSILLPSLRSAREAAKKISCQSRLNEITRGFWFYATSNRDHIPFVVSPITNEISPLTPTGQANLIGSDFDPYDRELWPMSLPNILMPNYLNGTEELFVCPSALVGYPRRKPYSMTFRPAAVNQPNGIIPDYSELAASRRGEFVYFIEHFGFLDGRKLEPYVPNFVVVPESGSERMKAIVHNELQRIVLTAPALREFALVIDQNNIHGVAQAIGPHKGGFNIINRSFEVEYREQRTMLEQHFKSPSSDEILIHF